MLRAERQQGPIAHWPRTPERRGRHRANRELRPSIGGQADRLERRELLAVVSTFDDPALREDGWVVTNDAVNRIPDYISLGGNPGGYIETVDKVAGTVMWFKAPGKFLGDHSADYGSLLTFDLKQTGAQKYQPWKIVRLVGGGMELFCEAASSPGHDWTSYGVKLDTSQGWKIDRSRSELPPVAATEANIRAVLGSLSALKIRAEFTLGPDTDSLDNVVLGRPDAAPGGPDVRVNTNVSGPQFAARIAVDAADRSVVVWHSQGQDGSGLGLYARRFDAANVPIGPEFRVNTVTAGDQYDMSVAMAPDGRFVIAWCGNGPGDPDGVFARRFDPAGNPIDNVEFRVNANTVGTQADPSVGVDPVGNFVVAWQTLDGDGTGWNVNAQKFRKDASRWGAETRVNTTAAGHQVQAQAAIDGAGNYAVAWLGMPTPGGPRDVYARRFKSDTTPGGNEFLVSPEAGVGSVDNQYPSLAMSQGDGRFVVVWNTVGNGWDAIARRYDAAGNSLGEPFYVADGPGDQYVPTSSMNSTGAFAVTWQDNRAGNLDVYAREYGRDGRPLGVAFRINDTTAGTQAYPSLALDGAGRLAVVWSGNGPGDADGVFARNPIVTGAQALALNGGTLLAGRAASVAVAQQAGPGTATYTIPSRQPEGATVFAGPAPATDAALEELAGPFRPVTSMRRRAAQSF